LEKKDRTSTFVPRLHISSQDYESLRESRKMTLCVSRQLQPGVPLVWRSPLVPLSVVFCSLLK
jgi:hypothetical protein